MGINAKSEHIRIEGHTGRWHVISDCEARLKKGGVVEPYYLLEHETYGDEAASLIIDKSGKVILDDVWNGFLDLREAFEDCVLYKIAGINCQLDNGPIYYEDIPRTISLEDISRVQDMAKAFHILQEWGKVIGCPIVMDPDCSNPLTLEMKENNLGQIFLCVEKDYSNAVVNCPKCGGLLRPSDVPGYENVCPACDENFN